MVFASLARVSTSIAAKQWSRSALHDHQDGEQSSHQRLAT
jgi:hypothetical protein